MNTRTVLFLASLVSALVAHQAFSQRLVTASIKPLQLIAMAITEGVSRPALVLDSSQDPHHPSLRPSQRMAMSDAAVFMWIGPQLETGMEQLVDGSGMNVIEVSSLEGMTRYGVGNEFDPHLWLDTQNVLRIAASLTEELARLDAGNASRYRGNLAAFREKVALAESGIRAILDTTSRSSFAVYHDGYQYFEKQFGLSHVVSFTRNEEVAPGIRQLLEIRERLDDTSTDCLVVGPSVNTGNLDNQLGRASMQYVVIDVLAHDIALGSEGYISFIRQVAEAFAACRA